MDVATSHPTTHTTTIPPLNLPPPPFPTPVTIGASETTEEPTTWGKALHGKGQKKVLWGEKVITKVPDLFEPLCILYPFGICGPLKKRGRSLNRFSLAPNFFWDENDPAADPPMDTTASLAGPSSAGPQRAGKRPRATMEDVEDEDDRWTQDFPSKSRAGAILEECSTQFEKIRQKQKEGGEAPWYPFESEDEWELGRWLMTSGLSQTKTDDYLKLKAVREGINPSFHNNGAFLQRIDALPDGPGWDPLECIKELLGNPAFTKQRYEPCRIFKGKDENGEDINQEHSEMWTAEWWWKIQLLFFAGTTFFQPRSTVHPGNAFTHDTPLDAAPVWDSGQ
ncbi:hypothetical protein B0H13DRAFT_1879026 [Mycena leptocephala]|nr:hypothetical protein B0H13DRAFT_1879026 [Mycena leptocephala]